MTRITRGEDGTLKATTAEGQILELLTILQKLEKEKDAEDRVQITYNINTFSVTGSFSIPAIQQINPSGQLVISAFEYIKDIAFNPGRNGTLKSTTATQYLIELVIYLQIGEQNPKANPNNENRISAQYDTDEKLFTGTVNLGMSVDADGSGRIVVSAVEYLLT